MAAVTQIRYPGTIGRNYYDRKVGEGMAHKSALRALKRRISDALSAQLIADHGRTTRGHERDPGGQAAGVQHSSAPRRGRADE
jgi:transposase